MDSWLEAAAALYAMPKCGPKCCGAHQIVWTERGHYRVRAVGTLPLNGAAIETPDIDNIERRLHK